MSQRSNTDGSISIMHYCCTSLKNYLTPGSRVLTIQRKSTH